MTFIEAALDVHTFLRTLSPEQKLELKRAEWQRLRDFYPTLPAEPNNAFLVSVALYTGLVPAFERLLASAGSLERFYA